ncbi:MAG: NADH-quinone oxidoreductase subunit H [Elusimicrobia bacterium]|nr:NADH-quinone oxidoreductase subunit H [Elusimicrobiota bacterium]MDE2236429.1 NADH-quinone oxidoreductase subunit H [Elusimicrobiota bacterium]MDE2424767.1 NADH-quinone oxidoreductase subunit H [Elusimicrobiota bacterium]
MIGQTVWTAVKVALALGFGMNMAGLLAWLERKQSAISQDRIGANRAAILGVSAWGLFNQIADALKGLTKENWVPPQGRPRLHALAPAISLGFSLFCLSALPFGGVVHVAGRLWSLQPLESSFGLPLVLCFLSLGVHGVVMAGYASGSNYGLLGGLRAAAQMISYEVCLAVSLAGCAFIYGTLDLQQAVLWQGRLLGGWLPAWGIVVQPAAFLLFLAAGAAVTKRAPFDVPEGESEIVGYFVEYSGMKFLMFLITDFIESIVIAGLIVTLFLGGWQIPWVTLTGALGGVLMLAAFSAKLLLVLLLLMQIRWTLPRFRFDQVLDLGWKNILPLAMLNFIVTVWGVLLWRLR